MRKIKFRGKRLDNGEWIYGDLYHTSELTCICDWSIRPHTVENFAVDPATVGQFTGLLENNDTEVYEGDILRVCNGSINGVLWFNDPYVVEYVPSRGFTIPAFLWDKSGKYRPDSTHWCEVIGNIHDNELLKTE